MNLRQWFNDNPQITTIVTVVALVAALGVAVWQLRSPVPTTGTMQVYFWDMQTNEAFPAPYDEAPPITAPSGGEGVRAYLYTCGECTPDEWFGYLEKFTDEAKQHYEREGVEPDSEGRLVRRLDRGDWVSEATSQGLAVIDIIHGSDDPCPEPEVEPMWECRP